MSATSLKVGRASLEPLERRRLLSSAIWEIHGDVRPKNKADVILVEPLASDPTRIQASVNGKVVGSRAVAGVKTLRILAGAGNDSVSVKLPVGAAVRVYVLGGSGDDSVQGSDSHDYLDGGPGDDLLQGNGGQDTLVGGDGDDVIAGAQGRDRATGGAGDDRIYGGSHADSLLGNGGADSLFGGLGKDQFSPGAGGDRVYKDRRRAIDRVLDRDAGDVILADPAVEAAFRRFGSEGEFDRWLIDAAIRRWQDLLGQVAPDWYYEWDGVPPMFKTGSPSPVAMEGAPGGVLAGAPQANDHSGTNTQVDGVDEADVVETDGKYIYIAAGRELVIVSADPADQMAVVSRTDVGSYISGIYLHDGTVTVLASAYDIYPADVAWAKSTSRVAGSLVAGDVWWNGSRTVIATYDVSAPAAPVLKEKTTTDGSIADSRAIDGRVYAVVSNNLYLPPPKVVGEGQERRYETQTEYEARLKTIVAERTLPQFTAVANGVSRTGTLVSVTDTYVSGDNADSQALTSVVLIDPSAGDSGPDATTTIAGPSGTIYATAESFYVTGWDWDDESGLEQNNIAKFDLGDGSVSLAAIGTVQGTVLDQFSMGENSHGDLNIATTQGWGNASSTNVFTLRQEGTRLDPVGAILNIAPGERMFSSRFLGDKGYLVTFRRVDPLFSLDLSDPFDPKVTGELKIPGFSSYLHPIGDQYLLGLGHEGDDTGAVFGLQLSLFDVRDPANPTVLSQYSFDGENAGTGSVAEYDHHAIQYFADQKILTLPVWGYDETDGSYSEGTAVIKVDPANGLQQIGFVEQTNPSRSLRIGDVLYTLGQTTLKASSLLNPGTLFGTVQISDPNNPPGGPIFID